MSNKNKLVRVVRHGLLSALAGTAIGAGLAEVTVNTAGKYHQSAASAADMRETRATAIQRSSDNSEFELPIEVNGALLGVMIFAGSSIMARFPKQSVVMSMKSAETSISSQSPESNVIAEAEASDRELVTSFTD